MAKLSDIQDVNEAKLLEREEMYVKQFEMQGKVIDHLQSQLQLQAQLQIGDTLTDGATGAESWVTEAILRKDLEVKHRFWFEEKGRWENENEQRLRSRVFAHLIDRVPQDLYRQLPDGDVRGVLQHHLIRRKGGSRPGHCSPGRS